MKLIDIKWIKDRDVVLAEFLKIREALLFAAMSLKQEQQLLIKSGLWEEDHVSNNNAVLIVLSTHFSLVK